MSLNAFFSYLFNCLIFSLVFLNTFTFGQIELNQNVSLSTYADLYYGYDFGNPEDHNRPDFLYSYHRHNEVNLNIGLLLLSYEDERVRSNFGLMAGTYVSRNLAHEDDLLKNIYEANIGLKLANRKSLWLEMGVFPSHIGFESAIGADCWSMTRSLLADNSPYYSSGAQLIYTTPSKYWEFRLLALNGWQRITRIPGQQTIAFGHQAKWTPDDYLTLNSSSFIGNEYPSEFARLRIFHNFYTQWENEKGFGFKLGVDVGAQATNSNNDNFRNWYGLLVTSRIPIKEQHAIAARLEFFNDQGVVTNYGGSFENIGFSTNYDYQFSENVLLRLEFRTFNNQRELFLLDNDVVKNNFYLGGSISFRLMD